MQISDQCYPSWVAHFAVFRDVILRQLGLSDTNYQYDYTYRMFCRYFVYHLVIAKTIFPAEEVLSPHTFTPDPAPSNSDSPSYSFSNSSKNSWTSTENLALIMCEETLNIIDPYSGLSNRLLLLVNDISDLKQEVYATSQLPDLATKRNHWAVLTIKFERMNTSLSNLQQYVSPSISDSDPVEAKNQENTAEAARLATLLLLNESYSAISWGPSHEKSPSSNSSPASVTPLQGSRFFSIDHKRTYTQNILNLIADILSHMPMLTVYWPLWPLFVASCCVDSDQDRIMVMDLFETAMSKSNKGVRKYF